MLSLIPQHLFPRQMWFLLEREVCFGAPAFYAPPLRPLEPAIQRALCVVLYFLEDQRRIVYGDLWLSNLLIIREMRFIFTGEVIRIPTPAPGVSYLEALIREHDIITASLAGQFPIYLLELLNREINAAAANDLVDAHAWHRHAQWVAALLNEDDAGEGGLPEDQGIHEDQGVGEGLDVGQDADGVGQGLHGGQGVHEGQDVAEDVGQGAEGIGHGQDVGQGAEGGHDGQDVGQRVHEGQDVGQSAEGGHDGQDVGQDAKGGHDGQDVGQVVEGISQGQNIGQGAEIDGLRVHEGQDVSGGVECGVHEGQDVNGGVEGGVHEGQDVNGGVEGGLEGEVALANGLVADPRIGELELEWPIVHLSSGEQVGRRRAGL